MTNSAYAKNNGDGLLYSILWYHVDITCNVKYRIQHGHNINLTF
jgi:hypothetical protein